MYRSSYMNGGGMRDRLCTYIMILKYHCKLLITLYVAHQTNETEATHGASYRWMSCPTMQSVGDRRCTA